MKTFTQRLAETNRNKLLEEVFILLEKNNFNSMKFVEILFEDNEINLQRCKYTICNESVEQQVNAASKALSDFHSRLARSSILREKADSKQFAQMILDLMNMLKDPSQIGIQEQPEVEPQQQVPTENYLNFINQLKTKRQIKENLQQIQNYGIDPKQFIEWYSTEGQYLNEGEYYDRFKDFLGNSWANIKGAWNRGMSGWKNPGNERQKAVDQQRDSNALNAAMQSIDELLTAINQEGLQPQDAFMNTLKQVQEKLQQELQTPPPQPQPQAPQQTQPQTQAPQQPIGRQQMPPQNQPIDYNQNFGASTQF